MDQHRRRYSRLFRRPIGFFPDAFPVSTLAIRLLIFGLIATQHVWITPAQAQIRGNQSYTVSVLDGPSFARVTIGTVAKRPVTEPHTFQIVIREFDYLQGKQLETTVVQPLTIPTGSVSATVEVPYPPTNSFTWGGGASLHIEQDGNHVFDPRRDLVSIGVGSYKQGLGYGITLLASSKIVSSFENTWQVGRGRRRAMAQMRPNGAAGLPTLQFLEQIVSIEGYSVRNTTPPVAMAAGASTGTPISTCQTSDVISGCPLGDLPQQWLGLVNVRNLLISWSDLKTLRASRPEACDALADWAAMGGHLFVYDCGDMTGDQRALLAVLTPQAGSPVEPSRRPAATWRAPSPQLKELDLSVTEFGLGDETWRNYRGYNGYGQQVVKSDVDIEKLKLVTPAAPDQEGLLVADFNRGYLACVRSDMSGWKTQEWMNWWNVQQLMSRSPMSEIGENSLVHLFNPEFNIPTLSEPPRLAFQLLITGFVLLVGPVFFIVFRRARRLYLWLLMTPLVSLLACFGMVVFAYFYEGFDTKGRVEAVTFLDHRNGTGSQHIRYAYYAGTQPSGYQFDSDFLVCDSRRTGSSGTLLTRRDDLQVIQGGDIRSRTEHQLTASRPVRMDPIVTLFRDAAGQVQIRNLGDAPIAYVVYRDQTQWYAAEDLGVGQTVVATPINVTAAIAVYRSLIKAHAPRNSSQYNRYSAPAVYYGYGYDDWSDSEGGILTRIREKLLSSAAQSTLPDRDGQYVAIIPDAVLIPDPAPKALYDKYKFHVIVGQN